MAVRSAASAACLVASIAAACSAATCSLASSASNCSTRSLQMPKQCQIERHASRLPKKLSIKKSDKNSFFIKCSIYYSPLKLFLIEIIVSGIKQNVKLNKIHEKLFKFMI